MQPDYAYVGGGYDTPSERTGRVLSGRKSDDARNLNAERAADAGVAVPPSDKPVAELPFSGRRDFLDGRFGNWTSSPEDSVPHNPNLPEPSPETGRPLGIVSGKPMPLWVTPPPIFGVPDQSDPQESSPLIDMLNRFYRNGKRAWPE